MKPIKLKLAGLHSFREVQEVDFERLCEAGLFGIFGTTGSGKSSILDAITLALYGQVERAARGTHGILNHGEDRVLVDFTFELARPEGRRRYRVERVYRRSGENTVIAAGGRLVEITPGGELPLAEKSKINDMIVAIVGLDKDEFTRAVVLPQGKFADFLKLEPARRRGMLQNLFGLQAYGDRLRQNVNSRLSSVANELTGVRGELEGLGDASDGALEQSLERLNNSRKRTAKAAADRVKVEEQVKKLERVWTWQGELNEVRMALEVLENRQPEINQTVKMLDAASRADKAKPYLSELDEAEANHNLAQTDLMTAGENLKLAAETAENAHRALVEAHGRRTEEEPALMEKRAWLAQADHLEKEISSLKDEGVELAGVLDKQEKEKSGVASSLLTYRERKQALEQSIFSCRAQLVEMQVAPERRRRVNAAVVAFQHHRKALKERELAEVTEREKFETLVFYQKAEEAAASLYRKAQENRKATASLEKELREHCPDDGEVLQSQFQALEKIRSQIEKVVGLSGELIKSEEEASRLQAKVAEARNEHYEAAGKAEKAAVCLERARKRVEEAMRRQESLQKFNLTSHLALSLLEGEPCPVCGSPHHPKPAPVADEEPLGTAEEDLRLSREAEISARDFLESARRNEALSEAGHKNFTEAYSKALAEQEQKMTDLSQMRSILPTLWSDLPAGKMSEDLYLAEEKLARRQEAHSSWRESLAEQQLALQQAQEAFAGASVAAAIANGDLKGAANAHKEAAERLQAAMGEEGLRFSALNEARGDLPVEQIEQEQQQIEKWDNEKTALEEKRQWLENDLEKINLELETLNRQENLLAVEISRIQEKLGGLRVQYKQKDEELKAITGGKTACELLDLTEAMIKRLKEYEEQAKQAFDAAERDRGRWEQESAAVERSFSLAGQRLTNGLQRLSAVLEELRFITRNEAEAALLGREELERMNAEVEGHRKEQEILFGRRLALVEKLDGRTLTEAQWSDWQESKATAQKEHEDALQEQGAAYTAYDKMIQDNMRWKELEQRGRELDTLKGRLEALEKLFRGNAFVEYLAGEQLMKVARDASARLGQLTGRRYALEVDSEGGFIMRDDSNGGVKRPVSTLSGGETFITSLALALALSAQIQLKGQYPLEFFFLDEGFGTLDPDLLEVVVSILEQLRLEHLTIGVISHVPELKNRLPRRLLVQPAQQSGAGSRVVLEPA